MATLAMKKAQTRTALPVLLYLAVVIASRVSAFSFMIMSSGNREIYNIPNSGWTSAEWNWGSAVGTGHDCAAICRQQFSDRQSRSSLVDNLRSPSLGENGVIPFEEVKLVLALAWQRGRWDGSDGGRGGYGVVLSKMAAQEYERGSEEERSRRLIQDVAKRFHLLGPSEKDETEMQSLLSENDFDIARRKCAGLVLQAMGFVENGL